MDNCEFTRPCSRYKRNNNRSTVFPRVVSSTHLRASIFQPSFSSVAAYSCPRFLHPTIQAPKFANCSPCRESSYARFVNSLIRETFCPEKDNVDASGEFEHEILVILIKPSCNREDLPRIIISNNNNNTPGIIPGA